MTEFLAIVKLSSTGAAGKTKFEAEDVMGALVELRNRARVQSTADIYEYELFKIVTGSKGGEGLVSVARKLATSTRQIPAPETVVAPPPITEATYTSYQVQAA